MALRWRIVALLFAVRVGLGLQFQTAGSVGDDMARAFGLSYAEIGTLVGLFMAPGLFLAIPAGAAGRYLSDRTLCGGGMLALALGGLVSAMAADPWLVGAGRVLAGGGFLFANLYFVKMTADWFSGKEIATAMAILVMSWPLGIALGQIAHEWLAGAMGWRWPFLVASAYCLAGAAALIAFYRPPEATVLSPQISEFRLSRRELVLTLIAALAWAAVNAGYIVYLTFGPLVLEAEGLRPIQAAAIVSIGSWVMIFSGMVCGHVSDRIGRPDVVLTICMVVAMGAMALFAVAGSGVVASLLFGLIGMAPAGIIMALTAEAMRPERRAFGMGVFLSVYFLVNAAAPPAAGWLYDRTGDPFSPILFGIAMFGLVIVFNAWFRLAQRRMGSTKVH